MCEERENKVTKIVFMGTPQFSVPILEGLVANNAYDVIAVVTQPDRPVGRKRILTPPPVKVAAETHHIPVLQPEKISGSEEMERIIQLNPDIIITAAFGQFLPTKLLDVPKFGGVNVHASLLPKYRGGAPVHYSLINGDKKTGISIIEMIKEMDAGGIYKQTDLDILPSDNVGTLFDKLSILGRDTLLNVLPDILSGRAEKIAQDSSNVIFSPTLSREEERLDWNKSAEDMFNQIRGMCPWPGAYTEYKGTRMKIWDSIVCEDESTSLQPGSVVEASKKNLKIACGDGSVLAIAQIQPSGKSSLTISEFMNGIGKQMTVGEEFN